MTFPFNFFLASDNDVQRRLLNFLAIFLSGFRQSWKENRPKIYPSIKTESQTFLKKF